MILLLAKSVRQKSTPNFFSLFTAGERFNKKRNIKRWSYFLKWLDFSANPHSSSIHWRLERERERESFITGKTKVMDLLDRYFSNYHFLLSPFFPQMYHWVIYYNGPVLLLFSLLFFGSFFSFLSFWENDQFAPSSSWGNGHMTVAQRLGGAGLMAI